MYRIMNREAGKADPFSVTGWGSKEVPPHPQPDETGRVKLVSGTAVSEEDKKQLERDLRRVGRSAAMLDQ